MTVELHNVLASDAARVLYAHSHFHLVADIAEDEVFRRTFQCPVKRRIAQTIAKRIHHFLRIPFRVIRAARLVIAIADVNVLLIVHKVVVFVFQPKIPVAAVLAGNQVIAKVLPHRAVLEIHRIGINRAPGRIHCAVQEASQRIHAGCTGEAHPDSCVDFVLIGIIIRMRQKCQFHR